MQQLSPAAPADDQAGFVLDGSLLLVEDDDVDAERVFRALRDDALSSLDIRWAQSLGEARELVRESQPQIVLADLTLPDARDLEVVKELVDICDEAALIVQTGLNDHSTPTRALELGAQDYLSKSQIGPEMLARSIRHAVVRRRTQEELIRAHTALRRSTTDLDAFANVVAHDLRAPVRTARLFANRLLHSLESDDPVVIDCGQRLDASLERVDRMILSMLDYASLAGTTPPIGPVSLGLVVDEAVSSLAADIEATATTITTFVDDNMMVMADSERLARVFINLIANSIKYQRVDVDPEIEIVASSNETTVTVTVRDNGIGVDETDAERAFHLLERLDPSRSTGLGFGLPICRRIVESSGGSIGFKPVIDPPGALIELTLPVVRAEDLIPGSGS